MKLVSVITPSFNSEKWIECTYVYLCNQTFQNWEWIITDDCSSDETVSVIKKMALKDSRIRLFENDKNSGAAVSRNNSIQHAKGEFLAFLDSDDLWLPEKLERQIEFMGSTIDFSFTAYELIDADNKRLEKTVDSTNSGCFSYNDMLLKKATLGCSTVVLRKSAFTDISMPLIRTGQDYALWLKILRQGSLAYIYPEVLTQYRILPGSISRNKIKKAKRQWEIYRRIESLGFTRSIYCFISYAFRAVLRKR